MPRERKSRATTDPALSSPPSDTANLTALGGADGDLTAGGIYVLAIRCAGGCGKVLTAPKSMAAGIGARCAARAVAR